MQSTFIKEKIYLRLDFVMCIWLLVTLIFVVDSWITNRLNNYLIFENVFRNLLNAKSLYGLYPEYHNDSNHYGPIFSLIIAPFAIFPNWLGLLFWNLFNCFALFVSVQTLPFPKKERMAICLIAVPCLVASMLNQQFNPVAGALIILNFTQLNRSKGLFSSLFMVLGIFVKIYGIVGLAFFLFVKDKPRYVLYSLMWALVLFMLPMLFSSPSFVYHSYLDWMHSLAEKNAANVIGIGRDMSIMGFFRGLPGMPFISNQIFIAIGAVLFAWPFLNFRMLAQKEFKLFILASALIFPIIFSTGAEDCTFIIAVAGVGIWYVLEHNKRVKNLILPLVLILSCDFPLLFFPRLTEKHGLLLSIISAIYFVVWIRILYCAFIVKKHAHRADVILYEESQDVELLSA